MLIVDNSTQPVGTLEAERMGHEKDSSHPRAAIYSKSTLAKRGLKLAPTTNHARLRTCAFESSSHDITRRFKIAR
jgi:hypothetical protein